MASSSLAGNGYNWDNEPVPATSTPKVAIIFRGIQHLQNALLPNNALSLLKLSSFPNSQIKDPLNFKDLLNCFAMKIFVDNSHKYG